MNDIKITGALSNYILSQTLSYFNLHIGQIHISSQLFITPPQFSNQRLLPPLHSLLN